MERGGAAKPIDHTVDQARTGRDVPDIERDCARAGCLMNFLRQRIGLGAITSADHHARAMHGEAVSDGFAHGHVSRLAKTRCGISVSMAFNQIQGHHRSPENRPRLLLSNSEYQFEFDGPFPTSNRSHPKVAKLTLANRHTSISGKQ